MPYLGEISALVTAFLWSGSAMIFTAATVRIGSMNVNINRLIFATILLSVTVAIMQLPIHLSSSQIINLSISAVIGLVFGDSFLFKAFQEIGARLSMLIMSLAPAIAAVLSYIFLGETLSIIAITGIVITIIGISIVVIERNGGSASKYRITFAGIVYSICGALGQGVGLIFARMAFDEGAIHGFVASFIRISVATACLLPVAVLTHRYRNPVKIFSKDRRALWLTIIGSLLGPYFGITFSLIAIANTHVGIAATIMSIVPILMLPLVRYVYKEKLSWRAIAGACVAVGGVAMLFIK